MKDFDFCSDVDGIEIDSVPHVCINAPGRPQIDGTHPEGTIPYNQVWLIAPEANVKLHTMPDESLCLVRSSFVEEESDEVEKAEELAEKEIQVEVERRMGADDFLNEFADFN